MEKYILTNLIYINEDSEDDFLKYEASVLPFAGKSQWQIEVPYQDL